jgi:hypothetical protein
VDVASYPLYKLGVPLPRIGLSGKALSRERARQYLGHDPRYYERALNKEYEADDNERHGSRD